MRNYYCVCVLRWKLGQSQYGWAFDPYATYPNPESQDGEKGVQGCKARAATLRKAFAATNDELYQKLASDLRKRLGIPEKATVTVIPMSVKDLESYEEKQEVACSNTLPT